MDGAADGNLSCRFWFQCSRSEQHSEQHWSCSRGNKQHVSLHSSMKTSTLQPDTARLAAVRLSNSLTVNVSRKRLIECHPGGSQPPIMELCKMSLVVKKRRREATVWRNDKVASGAETRVSSLLVATPELNLCIPFLLPSRP